MAKANRKAVIWSIVFINTSQLGALRFVNFQAKGIIGKELLRVKAKLTVWNFRFPAGIGRIDCLNLYCFLPGPLQDDSGRGEYKNLSNSASHKIYCSQLGPTLGGRVRSLLAVPTKGGNLSIW